MPDKVLVYSRFPKAQLIRFGERFELLNAAGKRLDEAFPAAELAGIRAMITAGGTPLRGDAMDLLPKLGAIICYGTGYDGVDLAAAARRGIAVGHSPGANAASVADTALTLMLASVRRLLVADNYVRSGDWAGAKPSPMMRPQAGMLGRKVGVYVRRRRREADEAKKRAYIEKYIPQLAVGLQQILELSEKEREKVVTNLSDVLERSRKM